MSNDITPTQKLELANELIEVINRYCEKNQIAEHQAETVLLLAYTATRYTITSDLELN